MALAVTLKAAGEADLGTGSHAVSEALTPVTFAADSLVLVVLGAINGNNAPATPYLTCTAPGLSFGAVADGYGGTDFQAVARALTADHSAGGSTTITVSSDGQNTLGIFFAVYEVTGHDAAGPIGATAGTADGTTDGQRTLTLDSAPDGTSVVIAGIAVDTRSGTNQVTVGTGWTEDAEVDSSGSNFGVLQTQRRTGSTSTSVVWDDVRTAGSEQVFSTGAVAVEVVEGAGGAVDGAAAGSYAYSGTATGQATAIGSADGSYGYTGAASGQATSIGSAAGSYGYAGTASGQATAVGSADGSYAYDGTAQGEATVIGSAAGSYGYAGTASGAVAGTGSASGSYGFSGTAEGQATVIGSASGSYGYSGTATGTGQATEAEPVVLPPFREPGPLAPYTESSVPAYRESALPDYQETT